MLNIISVIEDFTVDRQIAAAKARGDKTMYIPLHSGTDDFMSEASFEKFYWPSLKRIILKLVDAGITPYLFAEGRMNNKLEIMSDVPKGKVVYLLEDVDMKKAKATVGQVACICGNLSSQTLAFGTKEDVVEETKRLLDICAPGGGYVMDCSLILDNCNHDNLRAWHEATLKYGVY